jgi:hypothetical protein
MITRINYTGRAKLSHRMVQITLLDTVDSRRFELSWDFEGKVPADSRIYVEATSSGSPFIKRFPFGTVGLPVSPPDTDLSDLPGESVNFTIKVVDESEHIGRLLGLAEGIREKGDGDSGEGGRQPILPVNATDLGERVWKVKFAERPWLEVNNQIPGIMSLVKSDEVMFALIFPEVIRQILSHVLLVERFDDCEGQGDDWRCQWLKYGVFWHPDQERPPELPETPEVDRTEFDEWIENVVNGFCNRKSVRERFVTALDEREKL